MNSQSRKLATLCPAAGEAAAASILATLESHDIWAAVLGGHAPAGIDSIRPDALVVLVRDADLARASIIVADARREAAAIDWDAEEHGDNTAATDEKFQCLGCGYDRVGLRESARCPECGAEGRLAERVSRPDRAPMRSRRGRVRLALVVLLCGALAYYATYLLIMQIPHPIFLCGGGYHR